MLYFVCLQVLSLCCLASASVCIWKLTVRGPTLKYISTAKSQGHNASDIQHHPNNSQLLLSTQITAGWIILASLTVLFYQLFFMIRISGFICICMNCLKIPVGIFTVQSKAILLHGSIIRSTIVGSITRAECQNRRQL